MINQQKLPSVKNVHQDNTPSIRTALGNNHTFYLNYNKEESIDKDWINLFGSSEAKSKIEDETRTNFTEEEFYKLPRTKFDSTVLPVILSTWICREIVTEAFDIISSNDNVDADDISCFDTCLQRITLSNIPKTSTSNETCHKKIKSNHKVNLRTNNLYIIV
ncbi:hypothetical protein BDF21DRAFT_493975 [Thamnidium elegans]|nr:hypothetical protein BDF21DRAFT_493975 [Thamnidium elegans]